VVLQEQTTGSACNIPQNNVPSCLVTGIPASELAGVFDVAPLDVDGDGWLDLVVGRSDGTRVWINQPPEPGSGQVPAADPGSMLRLARGSGDVELLLSWGDSCSPLDTEFNVYQGTLGSFQSHEPLACHLDAHAMAFAPAVGDGYYLVVPTDGSHEGSYGTTSGGAERQQGLEACDVQLVGACE
jgi:hypothetical protein